MIVLAGSVAGAIVGIVTAWNLLAVPFLNSDLSPIVGAQRYAEDQKSQQMLADTIRDTAKTLATTNQNVEALAKWQARRDCEDHNRRIRIYTERLKANPRDQSSMELRSQALQAIQALPGCMLESP